MRNIEIASAFNRIADLLEIQDANPFRIRAYRRAAATLEGLTDNIEAIAERGALREISGVGEDLAKKILEYLATGTMLFYEELKAEVPLGVVKMVSVPGIGPKIARQIYDHFQPQNIEELEALCRTDKLLDVSGFKQKTIDNILRGVEVLKRNRGTHLLGRALPVANQLCRYMEAYAEHVAFAGSLRRMKEVVHDVDILAASSQPEKTTAAFFAMPLVAQVLANGATRCSVRLKDDLQVDLRVVDAKSWGAALHYFTGSKAHNIRMRERAIKFGYKLNEYGLFDANDRCIASAEEREIFERLNLPYIPPVLREDQGEIEAAAEDGLPGLIELADIAGDLHMHTNWTDGKYSTEQMIEAARDRGYKYIAITDHSKSLGVAGGLSDEDLIRHAEEVRELDAKYPDIRVLAGTEVDIRQDGSLDYSDALLSQLDFVVASVHSGFKQDRATLTMRVVKAMQNPYVRVIGHPTGRLIGDREPYELDLNVIMAEAARTRTCLEVNANFHRLDLADVLCRKAKESGVQLIINTDSHNYDDLENLQYGVATAQRGWIEKERVLNTKPVEATLAFKMNTPEVKSYARGLGFDFVGIAPVGPTPESLFYPEWLDRGYAGDMKYLERQRPERMDPAALLPGVRSVIVCAVNYNTDRPLTASDRLRAWVSRYAWGDDYHDVMRGKLNALARWVESRSSARSRAYVDAGPVLERVFAKYAGIGWFGRNTCIINEKGGSWLFLGCILTDLDLEYDVPRPIAVGRADVVWTRARQMLLSRRTSSIAANASPIRLLN